MPPSNKTSGGKASIPQVATINPCYIMRNFSPIPRRTQVFHIEKNGEVKSGLPSNLEQFEGEVIRPLPHHMYPEKLFSSDLIWPCHCDMDSGQYMLCISAQIEEAYNFLCEALERVSALRTNHRNFWYDQQFGKVRDFEQVCPGTCHPKQELWLQIEKDTVNKPVYKLVPATPRDLEWDHFTGKSTSEIGVPSP